MFLLLCFFCSSNSQNSSTIKIYYCSFGMHYIVCIVKRKTTHRVFIISFFFMPVSLISKQKPSLQTVDEYRFLFIATVLASKTDLEVHIQRYYKQKSKRNSRHLEQNSKCYCSIAIVGPTTNEDVSQLINYTIKF